MSNPKVWTGMALTLSIFLAHAASAADYGRIRDPNNPEEKQRAYLRCGEVPLPANECEQGRQDALRIGCITQDEANKLREWGLSPSCIAGKYRGWCSCGCFDPSTLISIFGENLVAKAGDIAKEPQTYQLKHLTDDSQMSSFEFEAAGVLYSTLGAESKPLVVIETEDGRTLKVTTQHAILNAEGKMVKAAQITPETLLLDQSGSVVAIKAVKTEAFSGNVVNFRLQVEKPIEHVIFAQGLAVGDQAWQSTLEDLQNQIVIRQ